MAKQVSSDAIIGNALILFIEKNMDIDIQKIYAFSSTLDTLLPDEYYSSDLSIEDFCDNYPFFVQIQNENLYLISDEKIYNRLNRYFRIGLPKVVVETFYKAFNQMLEKEKEKQKNLTYINS